jgi:hypothetical protein
MHGPLNVKNLMLLLFLFLKNTEITSVEITDNEFYVLRPLRILRWPVTSRFHLDFMRNELWDKY